MALAAAGAFVRAPTCQEDTLPTHRIPAAPAAEAASESVAACVRQGYTETAVVLDADGATIAALRGDGAGIHTLDSAHDKAYTSVSFKSDTIALEDRGRGEIAPLSKLPHVLFFGGGVVIKLLAMKPLVQLARAALQEPSWMTHARAGLEKIRDRLK